MPHLRVSVSGGLVTMTPPPSSHSFFDEPDTPREIHIWEFSQEFRVQLEPRLMEELGDRAVENVGGVIQLASVLNVKYPTLYGYRMSRYFIPLALLSKLCDLAGDEFSIEWLEPQIIGYKGMPWAKPILDPNLPLVETPALFSLMGHLTGDGGHSSGHGYYTNTQQTLIREFLRLLREVFGAVPVRVEVAKRKAHTKPVTKLVFGMTLVRLLQYLYHVDFRTYTARVPHRLFELPQEYAAAYLRAYGDDEGCVRDTQITLCSANKGLLQGINALVRSKFPELAEFTHFGEEYRNSKPYYNIRLRCGAFANYRTLIGFTHPEKKRELDRVVPRRDQGQHCRNRGETRRMLLKSLKSGPMTTKDLARTLDVTVGIVWSHLNGLKAWRFVQIRGKKPVTGWPNLFEITEQGRKFLQLHSKGLLSSWRGKTKFRILKILARRSIPAKEIGRALGMKIAAISNQLMGQSSCGKRYPGLLELGLVERSGNGGQTDPYAYHLTSEGRRVVEELDTLFLTL